MTSPARTNSEQPAVELFDYLRPWPVYVMAGSLPISLALANLGKASILAMALWMLVRRIRDGVGLEWWRWRPPFSVGLVIVSVCLFALSSAWTTASAAEAWNAWGKHAKLLLIPLCLALIRSPREAETAIGTFIASCTFVVVSSWLLVAGISLPWVPAGKSTGTVFSSYLDQSMLTGLLVLLCWHLKPRFNRRGWGTWVPLGVALIALANLFLAIQGRSGQAALLPVMALSLWWLLPSKLRLLAFVAPALIVISALSFSTAFSDRVALVWQESRGFFLKGEKTSSSGERLEFWSRSLTAIAEKPLAGHGVGSWNREYRRVAADNILPYTKELKNPHQEYLLWGVELGMIGIAVLIAFFAALWREALSLDRTTRDALRAIVAYTALLCLINSALFDAVTGETFILTLGLLLTLGRLESNPLHYRA